jgi:hypothetical protein
MESLDLNQQLQNSHLDVDIRTRGRQFRLGRSFSGNRFCYGSRVLTRGWRLSLWSVCNSYAVPGEIQTMFCLKLLGHF